MRLPDMEMPTAPHRSMRMRYHDGSERLVYWTEREVPYPDGRLIVSRTDLDGVLTHANAAFVEISGYPREMLIGAPHSILRHPDMPREAFRQLWETVQAGGKWHGYVKNLRRDGAYYWVYATALPNIRDGRVVGYTSVRRKPSRARIEAVLPLYRQWLDAEAAGRPALPEAAA
ncbi:PAS domain-containing protein [Luteimonas sp. BDR2-5]|uniref:PAS domain-containing protein n=1 Tax=Proluteimonas luteida TaxID=2878685 RepID=UPI001E451A47|nr:PAS domain-containing protein [Luteimonas sp. BDR2-5]MCD9027066.1 PAS domain-containing protein [Luteimonas sp. BDR2-5]